MELVYTVTLNPAVDKTVVIPNFEAGSVNRIQDMRIDAGGKGINVSKCIQSLGGTSVVCAILGGSSGRKILSMVENMGLDVLPVMVSGETRTNLKIVDVTKHENTDINEPGPEVTKEIFDELRQEIAKRIAPDDVVILSGSLPKGADAGLYREWCEYFRNLGVKVLLDADGEPMRQGIQAIPYLVKPNDMELSRLVGRELTTEDDLIAAGKQLQSSGIQEVLISRGEKGALYLTQEGIYRADGVKVSVLSTVGAGDSMVAAAAFGFEKGMGAPDRLRLAIAMGSASVTCSGTQAPTAELVWDLFEKVKVQEV